MSIPASGTRRWPGWARAVVVALQFLTRIPVPSVPMVGGDLRRATAAFPLVGVVVAGVAIGARAALAPLLPATAATVAAVLLAVAVTGAFHEDGLADTVDGLWGGWTPQRRVEIMRDSRLGTYGAVALVGSFALRVALLAPLDLAAFARAALTGHVVGRLAILAMIRLLPAWSDQGSGAQVAEPVGAAGSAVALATTLAVCVGALGVLAPVPLLAAAVGVGACRRAVRRRLGGLTGDTLGATQQVVHLLCLASVSALALRGLA